MTLWRCALWAGVCGALAEVAVALMGGTTGQTAIVGVLASFVGGWTLRRHSRG